MKTGEPAESEAPLFHVVLVEPEIPPNTGNVARLCSAARCRLHLVGPLGFKLDDTQLKRAGMDYWRFVDWRYHESIQDAMAERDAGAATYCVETSGEKLYTEVPYRRGDFLVFGRETRGLRRTTIDKAGGTCVRIPILDSRARSLNLSNAVAVVVYEALRQNAFGMAP